MSHHLDLGRGRQFQAENRLQFVDGSHTCGRSISVRLIHQENEVIQTRQIVEIALPNVLAEAFDSGGSVPSDFAVDLGDVEDVNVYGAGVEHPPLTSFLTPNPTSTLVVVARDEFWGISREFRYALEDVLRSV